MAEKLQQTVFGQRLSRYGITSLVTACLAYASCVLVVVVGIFLWICVLVPLLLICIISGLVGVGAGVYYEDWLAVVAGTPGLVLAGGGAWVFVLNLTNF